MEKMILFDMDGTLIDSTNAICESFNQVFIANDMPRVEKSDVARYIGYTLQDMFVFLVCQERRWIDSASSISSITRMFVMCKPLCCRA